MKSHLDSHSVFASEPVSALLPATAAKSVYRVYLDSACFSTYSDKKASFIRLFLHIPDTTSKASG